MLFKAVQESCADADDSVLKCLVELCEDLPKYIRTQVENLLTTCMKVRHSQHAFDRTEIA